MAFAFEDLKVYQRSLDFAVNVIEKIDDKIINIRLVFPFVTISYEL